MKKNKVRILLVVVYFFMLSPLPAQKFKHVDKYIDFISKQQAKVIKQFYKYDKSISYIYKKKSVKKIETAYNKLTSELTEAKTAIDSMPSFKGDSTYKDSALIYISQYTTILDDQYKKISRMKDAPAQLYDNLQELLSSKEPVEKKIKALNEQLHALIFKFITVNKITPANKKYDIDSKMNKAIETGKYYKMICNIFYKSYKEETYLQNAIERKDDNDFKKERKDISKNSDAGLNELDTLRAYKSDTSLIIACKNIVAYYGKEADDKIDPVSDYFSAMKDFEEARTLFNKKTGHSGKEVSAYKKHVKEYNKAISKYNKTMSKVYKKKKSLLNKWNSASNKFINKHMPK